MINILDRYLLIHVLGGTLLTLLVLGGLDGFIAFINELDTVGRGDYGHAQAALYILFTLPRRIYEYAPTAMLIGSLLSLGGMAGHGEITAIRAAGLSIAGIARAVLKAGFIFVLLIFLLGEFVAPDAQKMGQKLRSESISGKVAVQDASGIWMRNRDLFVKARVIINNETMLDLSVYRFDGVHLSEIVKAKLAEKNEAGWLLKNIRKLAITPDKVTQTELAEEQWPKIVNENLFEVLRVNPEEMAARDLSSYVGYLRDNDLESGQYELAFWNRFVIPLSSLVMLLLALPFIFGSQRTGGAGQRLFMGVMLGVGYFLVSRLLNQLGIVYGLPALLSAVLPALLFLGLAVFLLRRV